MNNNYVDAYGDCELLGDVDRDTLGDLQASNVRLEMRVEGRLMLLKPVCAKDRAHLVEILISRYELLGGTKPQVEAI